MDNRSSLLILSAVLLAGIVLGRVTHPVTAKVPGGRKAASPAVPASRENAILVDQVALVFKVASEADENCWSMASDLIYTAETRYEKVYEALDTALAKSLELDRCAGELGRRFAGDPLAADLVSWVGELLDRRRAGWAQIKEMTEYLRYRHSADVLKPGAERAFYDKLRETSGVRFREVGIARVRVMEDLKSFSSRYPSKASSGPGSPVGLKQGN